MKVKVSVFASLGNGGNLRSLPIEIDDQSTVADLLSKLCIHPLEVGVLMVNAKSATFDQRLNGGDRVTVIPPIGGG